MVETTNRPLGENARDEMRQALAWLDNENRVTVLRARSLARLARKRGFALTPTDLVSFRGKIERDRRLFGDCVVRLDPLELKPVATVTPATAGDTNREAGVTCSPLSVPTEGSWVPVPLSLACSPHAV